MPPFKHISTFIDSVASVLVVYVASGLTLYHSQLCFVDQSWLNIFR